jgi:hypothetical protein
MFKKNNFVYQNKISEEFLIKGIVYSVNGQMARSVTSSRSTSLRMEMLLQ